MFSNTATSFSPGLSYRETLLVSLVPAVCKRKSAEEFEKRAELALRGGISRGELKEILLQLTIYAGFPKVLEGIKKLKRVFLKFDGEGLFLDRDELPSRAPTFNFFKLAEVERSLNDIDPDFAHYALLNAVPLCDRSGLSARERALVILASDICNEVFEGPFQIHTQMALKSDTTIDEIETLVSLIAGDVSQTAISEAYFALHAIKVLPTV